MSTRAEQDGSKGSQMTDGIYVAMGANLGNRAANIALALKMMAPLARVEAVSPLYESSAADGPGQPEYYNAVCRIVTGLGPDLLLAHLKRVEQMIGRRRAARWSPRPIDLDIALYDDVVLATAGLTVPHPRLTERAFVLRPLLDLDPDLTLPDGRRLSDLAAASGELKLVADGEWWKDASGVGASLLGTM